MIRRYRNLTSNTPIAGRQVVLYYRPKLNDRFKKMDDKFYSFINKDGNGAVSFRDDWGQLYVIRGVDKHLYQWVYRDEDLNFMQHLFGKYYLGLVLLLTLIYLLLT